MPSETVLFHLDDVIVTNRRLTIHQQSFALQSISRVQLDEMERPWVPTLLSFGAAVVLAYATVATGQPRFAAAAALCLVLSGVLRFYSNRRYALQLDTEDGPFVPLVTPSRFLITGLVRTLEAALRPSQLQVEPALSMIFQTKTVPTKLASRAPAGEDTPAGQAGWTVRLPKAVRVPGTSRELPASLFAQHRTAATARRAFHPGKTG